MLKNRVAGTSSAQLDSNYSGATQGMSNFKTPLSNEERELLVIKYRVKARKLAQSILRKWHSRLEVEDIESVVDLSLCESAMRYDPTYGASFLTFLYFHLRGNLIRTVSEAITGNGILETDELDSDRAKSAVVRHGATKGKSKLANQSDVTDLLYSKETETPDHNLYQTQISAALKEACEKLDPMEREIIIRIFLKEQQLVEVAESMGFSRCHVSRLKRRALEALSIHLSNAGVKNE